MLTSVVQPEPTAVPSAVNFFQSYLAAFVVFACYLFWKIYSHDWSLYVKVEDMDLESDLRVLAEEKDEASKGPWWKRITQAVW